MSSNDLWSIQRGDRQTDKTAAFRSTFPSVCPEPVLTNDLFLTKKQHRTPAKKALFPTPSVQPKRKAACFSAFFSPAHRIVEGGASIILTSSTAQQGRASKNERGGRLKIGSRRDGGHKQACAHVYNITSARSLYISSARVASHQFLGV